MNFLFPNLLAFLPVAWHVPDELRQVIETVIRVHPSIFSIALAILPAFGVPISPICVLGGAVYGIHVALAFGFVGIAMNLLLTYFLSTRVLRSWLESFLAKRGHHVWTVPGSGAWRAVLLVRFMPGIPMAVQSYLLGLAGVSFKPFFWVSLFIETLYMTAFVVTAGTFFEGNWAYLALGASLLIVVVLFAQIVRHVHNSANRVASK